MKVNIKEVEKILGRKLKHNIAILGIDSASTSGMALLDINSTQIEFTSCKICFGEHTKGTPLNSKLDVGMVNIKRYIDNINKPIDTVVIETPYLGLNRNTYGVLSTLVGIHYAMFKPIVKRIALHNASSTRKIIGFDSKKLTGDRLKKWVVEYIASMGFGTLSHDEADAVILALSEALAPIEVQKKLAKKKK